MKIVLHNFRCHGDLTREFPDWQLSLLSGPSGIGKSTIFDAIYFVIYGKMQHITPHDNPKACTSVFVDFGSCQILRQRKPNKLVFQKGDAKYDTEVQQQGEVQKAIEECFSKESVFLASSYLVQNERSPILISSNIDRMNIVHQISFENEDPMIYLTKIAMEMKNLELVRDNQLTQYGKEQYWIQSELNKGYYNLSDAKTQEEFDFIRKKEELLRVEKEKESKLRQSYMLIEIKRNTLMKQLEELRKQKAILIVKEIDTKEGELLESEILNLTKTLEGLKKEIYIWEERKRQQMEMRELRKKQREQIEEERRRHFVLIMKERENKILMMMNDYKRREKERENRITKHKEERVRMEKEREKRIKESLLGRQKLEEERQKRVKQNVMERERLMKQIEEKKKVRETKVKECQELFLELEKILTWREKFSLINTKSSLAQKETLMRQEAEYKIHSETTGKLGVAYDQEIVKVKLKELKTDLEKCKIYIQMSELKLKIESITSKFTPEGFVFNDEELKQKEKEFHEYLTAAQLLTCPSCHENLRFVKDKLVKSGLKNISQMELDQLRNEIEILKKRKEKVKENITRQNEYNSLMLEFNQLRDFGVSQMDTSKEEIESKIYILEHLKFVSLPEYSSKELTLYFNYTKCVNECPKEVEENIPPLLLLEPLIPLESEALSVYVPLLELEIPPLTEKDYPPLPVLELPPEIIIVDEKIENKEEEIKKISKLESELNSKKVSWNNIEHGKQKQRQINEQSTYLEKEIKGKENELSLLILPLLGRELSMIEKEWQEIMLTINKAIEANKLMIQVNNLENLGNQIQNLNTDILALESLEKRALGIECKQLQNTVNTFNTILNEILGSIFTLPMSAIMKLVSEDKDQLRYKVSFDLTYDGNEVGVVRQLSGGEGDRLSFAITLALCCLSGSPILMLDEPFGALDNDIRDLCVSALKRYLKGKTVLCISHEDTRGRYDFGVELSEPNKVR